MHGTMNWPGDHSQHGAEVSRQFSIVDDLAAVVAILLCVAPLTLSTLVNALTLKVQKRITLAIHLCSRESKLRCRAASSSAALSCRYFADAAASLSV